MVKFPCYLPLQVRSFSFYVTLTQLNTSISVWVPRLVGRSYPVSLMPRKRFINFSIIIISKQPNKTNWRENIYEDKMADSPYLKPYFYKSVRKVQTPKKNMDKWSILEVRMVRKYEHMSKQRDRHFSSNKVPY